MPHDTPQADAVAQTGQHPASSGPASPPLPKMIRIQEIIDSMGSRLSAEDMMMLQKAYVFSAAAHEGQTRNSGEPYLSHPLSVASILANMNLDAVSVAAALLHDTVEDTDVTVDEVAAKFGVAVARVVDGVTKISKISFTTKEEAQAENIRKMVVAMSEDLRVIVVKLADRLHNMRTLEFMKPHKQKLVAQETMDIYAPLANRLGLNLIKTELEDLCLKYLKPEVYDQLATNVRKHITAEQGYIDKVRHILEQMLGDAGISGRVSGRNKHMYSIYKKMLEQDLSLDQIYDLNAFRVVTKGLRDCYGVLGLVHERWTPVPGRFKDYISMPKANMYQSLHTTVIGPDGERIEIQIRTEEMHKLAEYGVAAHWQYKEGSAADARNAERFSWLREIMDWQKETTDSREFMDSLRTDLFHDSVYIFTPSGDVKELPEGATPVDFAYAIHTEVGDHCTGANVNGKLVSLSTRLGNGDTVKILTDKNRMPTRDWLEFVRTSKARRRVQSYLRTVEREHSIALGKEMLEKQWRKMGLNFAKELQKGTIDNLAKEFSFVAAEDLISSVGFGRLTPRKVLNRMLPEPERRAEEREGDAAPDKKEPVAKGTKAKADAKGEQPADKVRIQGVDGMLVRYAQCCDPVPGDAIVGYISRGRGVTVHTADCPNVANLEADRLLSVSWEGQREGPYPAKISIKAKNDRGVLATISAMLAEEQVNIESGTFFSNEDGATEIVFTIEVRDSAHLYATIGKLADLDTVYHVNRMTLQ